jgi:hypothetical protein
MPKRSHPLVARMSPSSAFMNAYLQKRSAFNNVPALCGMPNAEQEENPIEY